MRILPPLFRVDLVCGAHSLPSSAWLHPKDMSALQPHEIEAFLADDNKKRNGDLHKGYQIALDSSDFVREQRNNVRALKESMDNAQVDQLESENEEGDDDAASKKSKGSTTKKRKRDSEAEPAKAKRASKAATTTTKKGSAEPAKKKKAVKKNGAKSKALVESEDEGDGADGDDDDDDAGPSKKTSPPPAKKAKRDKDDGGDYGAFLRSLFPHFCRCYVAWCITFSHCFLSLFSWFFCILKLIAFIFVFQPKAVMTHNL